ncbi:MAG: hypothetical protein KBA61_01995 [Spirochaetes bacterium]|nr:hypothetical protein [Spirochaetota bacterium]
MKIYSFPGNYQNSKSTRHFYEHGTSALKRDRNAMDRVEISEEARKRYEAARIIELDKMRSKSIAHKYEPIVREALSAMEHDIIRTRKERIAELQVAYNSDNFVISDEMLRTIAKTLF